MDCTPDSWSVNNRQGWAHGLPCAYHTIIYVRDEREPGDNKQHGVTGALTIISLIILGLIQKLIKLKIPIMD